jgi:PadR family transcriptional regulator, regulatory protein AphA
MSLTHAILGFLASGPKSGYTLKVECFDVSVNHFWPADQAQIYRTLDKLAEGGLVESQLKIQTDRPNSKIYHITETGRAELLRWLMQDHPMPDHREAFLIQLYFARHLSADQVRARLLHQLEQHHAMLTYYHQCHAQVDWEGNGWHYQRFTLEFGIRFETMYCDWLNHCLSEIERPPVP